jgi:tetratricopeptide (TPR) repeat protein
MIIILPVVTFVISIASLVLFIMVLVKLFKTKGVLHGILGIISCGFYPLIWGWIKHKELQLTKIMAIWTGTMVLSLAIPLLLIGTGTFMLVTQTLNMFETLKSQTPPPPRIVQQRVRKPAVKPQPQPAAQQPAQKPVAKAAPQPVGQQPAPKVETRPAPKPAAPPTVATPPPQEKPAPNKPTDSEFEMKMTALNNLIKLDNTNADAFYDRGWLYVYKGDLQMAEKDYSKAIEIKKRDVDAYYNRGLVYIKMKKYQQAIKDFSEAIKLQPDRVDAYCNRGNANFQLGKMDLALNDYNAALKIDPKDADLYYNRAIVYLAKGERNKSKADFQKAAQLGHNKAEQHPEMTPEKPKT